MLKYLLLNCCLAMFFACGSFAQTNNPNTTSNCDGVVQGVRFAITATNLLVRGGSMEIHAIIQNLSTNPIVCRDRPYPANFNVFLTDQSNQVFNLMKIRSEPRGSSLPILLKAGTSNTWIIPVVIGPDLNEGDYELKASRMIEIGGNASKVDSNLLKVRLK